MGTQARETERLSPSSAYHRMSRSVLWMTGPLNCPFCSEYQKSLQDILASKVLCLMAFSLPEAIHSRACLLPLLCKMWVFLRHLRGSHRSFMSWTCWQACSIAKQAGCKSKWKQAQCLIRVRISFLFSVKYYQKQTFAKAVKVGFRQ